MIVEEALLALALTLAGGQLQHAAGGPQGLLGVEACQPAPAVLQRGQLEATGGVGLGGQLDVERALAIAGGTRAGGFGIDQRDLHAAPRQRLGAAGAGDTGAEYRDMRLASDRRWLRSLSPGLLTTQRMKGATHRVLFHGGMAGRG